MAATCGTPCGHRPHAASRGRRDRLTGRRHRGEHVGVFLDPAVRFQSPAWRPRRRHVRAGRAACRNRHLPGHILGRVSRSARAAAGIRESARLPHAARKRRRNKPDRADLRAAGFRQLLFSPRCSSRARPVFSSRRVLASRWRASRRHLARLLAHTPGRRTRRPAEDDSSERSRPGGRGRDPGRVPGDCSWSSVRSLDARHASAGDSRGLPRARGSKSCGATP